MSDAFPALDRASAAADDDLRQAQAAERWRRRSELIRLLRRALPIAMGLILLGLLAAVITAAILGRGGPGDTQDEVVRMVNPKFYGRASDGRAYTLSATEATRLVGGEAGRIGLTAPDLVLSGADGRKTRVQAQSGIYDETGKILRLTRDVRLTDATGNRFNTEEAVVNTETNAVRGGRPISGDGPTGRIAAGAYALYDQGARVVFAGGVKARLERGATTSAVPATAAPAAPARPEGEVR